MVGAELPCAAAASMWRRGMLARFSSAARPAGHTHTCPGRPHLQVLAGKLPVNHDIMRNLQVSGWGLSRCSGAQALKACLLLLNSSTQRLLQAACRQIKLLQLHRQVLPATLDLVGS